MTTNNIELLAALKAYEQASMDGSLVKVSRQAIDEAIALLERQPAMPADADGLRTQLEWTISYAEQSLKTNSKDLDDWKGDMAHIATSARRRIEGE